MPSSSYSELVRTDEFRNLIAAKKRFIIPCTVFFVAFYMLLPILTSCFPHTVTKKAIGDISWAWVLGFAQFVMTWTMCGIYSKKAAEFDVAAASIKEHGGEM